jgi:ubiquinone/menaquinone biosynthesis C-methylase UbiE
VFANGSASYYFLIKKNYFEMYILIKKIVQTSLENPLFFCSLKKLKNRLLGAGNKVAYLVSDVTEFRPPKLYDLWHDRATFHFLTQIDQVKKYLETAKAALKPGGNLIISTFSKDGPEKCSGLPIHQYSESELKELFQQYFTNTRCFEDTHVTPWGKTQSFVYCGFTRK